MTLRPFIIDCDTGRDDALAIWTALALGLPLAGVVSSYGNVGLPSVIDNNARILAFAGRGDIPHFAGASRPSRGHCGIEQTIHPRQRAAGNGLCDVALPEASRAPEPLAPERLAAEIRALAARHGPLDYIITGPATNFAALCAALGTDIHKTIARVTMMGGKLDGLWSDMPVADFNLLCDPWAVRQILEAGFEIRFVPMDFTWTVFLATAQVEALRASTPIGEKAREIMLSHCRNFAPEPFFRFHDPCVIMAALHPEGFSEAHIDIVCDEDSSDFARIKHARDGYPVSIFEGNEATARAFLAAILASQNLH